MPTIFYHILKSLYAWSRLWLGEFNPLSNPYCQPTHLFVELTLDLTNRTKP